MPASAVSVKIIGAKAIAEAMRALPKQINRRKEVLDPGLLAAAKIVRDDARVRVPVDTGVLKRNIIMQRWRRPEAGMSASVVVRVRKLKGAAISRLKARNLKKGNRLYKGDPFYWRFVEFSTSKKAARPFLRPAFETKKKTAVDAAIVEFRKRVQDIVATLGRRSGMQVANDYLSTIGGRR